MCSKTLAAAVAFVIVASSYSNADTFLESATLGSTQRINGSTLATFQYIGARFHLDSRTIIDHIGGHIGGDNVPGESLLFGAIAHLSGPNALPSGTPADFEPIAVAIVPAVFRSNDLLVPLHAVLDPGDYALIFGSGRFGAMGKGIMPNTNTDTVQASYFIGSFPSLDTSMWKNAAPSNVRFVVMGTEVPEPTTFVIALMAVMGSMLVRRTAR
jgi:hypothetical protein